MNQCIIGIGSNINASENIRATLNILSSELNVLAVSEMVKTSPIGIKNQPEFTNGAVKIETDLERKTLQQYLKKLEDRLGRDRTLPRFGPRTIDLDIIIWNNKVIDNDYYTRNYLQTACAQLGYRPDSL